METTIKLEIKTKEKLDTFKLSKRESYNEVIKRMISECKNLTTDEESLKETIDILSDPETLQDIAEALHNFEKRKYVELK